MKLSLSNGVFSNLSLLKNFTLVKKLGFTNIEFNMRTVEQGDEKSVFKVKEILGKLNIKCLSLHAATFPVTDEIEIPKAIYFGKVSAIFANILSAPTMVVHSNVSRKLSKSQRKKFLNIIFKEIQSYAKKFHIKLALENLSDPSKSYGKNLAEIKQILDIIDDVNIGLTLDFCHGETTGQTLALFEKYKNRLTNVHISNKKHKSLNPETPNLKEFLIELQDFGYNGPLTIEMCPTCTLEQILKTKETLENILSQPPKH